MQGGDNAWLSSSLAAQAICCYTQTRPLSVLPKALQQPRHTRSDKRWAGPAKAFAAGNKFVDAEAACCAADGESSQLNLPDLKINVT